MNLSKLLGKPWGIKKPTWPCFLSILISFCFPFSTMRDKLSAWLWYLWTLLPNMVEVMVPRSGVEALGLGQYGHKVNIYKKNNNAFIFSVFYQLGSVILYFKKIFVWPSYIELLHLMHSRICVYFYSYNCNVFGLCYRWKSKYILLNIPVYWI